MIVYTNRDKVPFEIDDDDYIAVSYFSWHMGHAYVTTTVRSAPESKHRQYALTLQIFLLGKAPVGTEWDHFDRNKRSNLRAVPHCVNKRNENPNCANVSGIRGVSQFITKKGIKQWQVSIRDGKGNRIFLGIHDTLKDAARARKDGEDRIWGDQR